MNGIRMQDGGTLAIYFRDLALLKPLSRDEEVALALQIGKGSQKAREKLISANLRFVVTIAMKYQNRGISLEDLVSSGNRGLITAVDRFDGSRGFKFISYAVWWIRQAIQESLSNDNRTIRLPVNRIDLLNNISIVRKNWSLHHERDPEIEDIAKVLDVSVEMVQDTLMRAQEIQSLDANFSGGDNKGSLSSVLDDPAQALPDCDVMEDSMREQVTKVLNTLSPREIEIIRLYFGFGDEQLNLEEIGKRFNVTRERVRQIKARALQRLQHPTRREQLESLLETA